MIDALNTSALHPDLPRQIETPTLLADRIAYEGENQCEIWDAYARRGMGVNAADGGSSDSLTSPPTHPSPGLHY